MGFPKRWGPPLTGVKRHNDDCLRAAVAFAYGHPYDETPADSPLLSGSPRTRSMEKAGWGAWAKERGLAWCWSWEVAPVCLPRWIACVDCYTITRRRRADELGHAVVMEFERVLFDPSEPMGGAHWTKIGPEDLRKALWLEPTLKPGQLSGKFWRIPNPGPDKNAPGVVRLAR